MDKIRKMLELIESLRVWKRKIELIQKSAGHASMGGCISVGGELSIHITTYNGGAVIPPKDVHDLVCAYMMQSLNTTGILAAFDRAIAGYEEELRLTRESISPETRALMREILGDAAAKAETGGG